MTLKYFAYGSNLHFDRFKERVPSARIMNTATLPGHRLSFCKHGADDSGKCTIISATGDVHGVIYEIHKEHKPQLDQCEIGYETRNIIVTTSAGPIETFTYVAQADMIKPDLSPYHWYKLYVWLGAQAHGLDPNYCAMLAEQNSIDDPDNKRSNFHLSVLGIDPQPLN